MKSVRTREWGLRCKELKCLLSFKYYDKYRVIQEERKVCWEIVVSVMARNKSSHEYVCNDELLPRKGGVKGRRETRLNLQIQKKVL